MKYETPDGWVCPHCGEQAEIVPLDNSFSYAGTHCSHGMDGIHYPADYGEPVCSECESFIEDI